MKVEESIISENYKLTVANAELLNLLISLWNISSIPEKYRDKVEKIERRIDHYIEEYGV